MNYSGFWRRFGAHVIDGAILTIPSLILARTGPFGLLGIFLGVAYYPVFESSQMCATPGKALLNIIVLNEAGERLTFKKAVIRYFCRYLSAVSLGIGYLIQPFTAKRQTLHDIIAESVVVERKAEDLNYFQVWLAQFKDIVNRL